MGKISVFLIRRIFFENISVTIYLNLVRRLIEAIWKPID